MILYHGSREVVKSPEIRILRYSKGFYARFSVIWDMKRDGIPVLRGKQSKFIFIQMKELVNKNGLKIQNSAVNVRGNLL